MALIKCPECDLQVSDKAISCPHCGYPLDKAAVRRPSTTKRPKLPHRFGSITELKNRQLRNPFWARVYAGRNELGRPILKPLKPKAYFATYNEAYEALYEYNKNPYDLEDDITVKELYEKWTKEYFKDVDSTYIRTIESAWSYCSALYSMRAKDVRARHIKGVMEDGYRIEYRGKKKGEKIKASAGTKSRIKSLFNLMFDYALEFEIVQTNYARTFDVSKEIMKEQEDAKKEHFPFTEKELQKLWDNVDTVKFADWVLIQTYMGWRPQELATLRLDEVDLEKWYMQAGMKTDAGKQRIVPIHSRIRSLVKKNYDFAVSINSPYLFNDKGQTHAGSWKVTYDKYANRFYKVLTALEIDATHRPHDPRKTFITRAKRAGMDEYALKEMVGHSIADITESTYTVRDLEWLREDLEKLK